MGVPTHATPDPHAAVVWLDHWHALVARRDHGHPAIVDVERGAEPEQDYLHRVAEVAEDCERLMILGPDDDLTAFGREYATLYRRVDRFVDAEVSVGASGTELLDRLRLLEGDDRAIPAG